MAEKDIKKKGISLSLDLQALKVLGDRLTAPIRKHSSFILSIIALSLIAYSAIMVTMIIQRSDDPQYRDEQSVDRISSSFDKQTIQKVDNLRNSAENSSIELPAGRRNPFTN